MELGWDDGENKEHQARKTQFARHRAGSSRRSRDGERGGEIQARTLRTEAFLVCFCFLVITLSEQREEIGWIADQ